MPDPSAPKLVLISSDFDISVLAGPIREAAPECRIHQWGDRNAMDADVAVCWNPPPGALKSLRSLRLVHSIAAGVDNILRDPEFPDVPLCRVVDAEQARLMNEFVLWGVLHFHRGFDQVLANQRKGVWALPTQRRANDYVVGIMGLGEIGARVAVEIARNGFAVRGWSRHEKSLPGVTLFSGAASLPAFLSRVDVLVCLLPLTHETRGLIDARFLQQLPVGARLLHVGRGDHLVMDDVLAALSSGQLGGAIVDVFASEPLAADSPLWTHPNLIVTPHMAAVSRVETIAAQIAANVRRLARGEALANQVNVTRGF